MLTLARSWPCGPGRSGPARCSAGYPLRDARSCLPARGPAGRAARAPLAAPRDTRFAALAHACPLVALRAGPLGPRSLLRGIPASRRSLMLARSWPCGPGRSGPARSLRAPQQERRHGDRRGSAGHERDLRAGDLVHGRAPHLFDGFLHVRHADDVRLRQVAAVRVHRQPAVGPADVAVGDERAALADRRRSRSPRAA